MAPADNSRFRDESQFRRAKSSSSYYKKKKKKTIPTQSPKMINPPLEKDGHVSSLSENSLHRCVHLLLVVFNPENLGSINLKKVGGGRDDKVHFYKDIHIFHNKYYPVPITLK